VLIFFILRVKQHFGMSNHICYKSIFQNGTKSAWRCCTWSKI